jgi:hypothetical protein
MNFFAFFPTDSNSASNFATKTEFFAYSVLALLANFKAKLRQNGSINEKRVL